MSDWDQLHYYLLHDKPLRTPDDHLVDANDIAMPEDEIAFWKNQPRDEHGRWVSDGQDEDEGPG